MADHWTKFMREYAQCMAMLVTAEARQRVNLVQQMVFR
jgi:hypothetical protein